MIDDKVYRLDSREITVCPDGDVSHEALLVLINNAKEKVFAEYPEAKNLKVVFERSQGDTIIKLEFERYETDEERNGAENKVATKVNVKEGRLKKILLCLVVVALIIVGYKCSESPTRSEENLPMDSYVEAGGDESDEKIVDSRDGTILAGEDNSVDIVGVWCGSTNWGGVVMTETIEFNKDGSGYYKINNDVLPFTWKKKDSSIIEFYSSEGKQVLKIDNGRIIDVSASGMNGTVFEKQ